MEPSARSAKPLLHGRYARFRCAQARLGRNWRDWPAAARAGTLTPYQLTPADVEDALRKQNVEVPAGRIESREREFSVVANTALKTPEQFGAIVVRTVNGYPVTIADLGRVEIGAASQRSSVRFNGRSAVALGVIKQATANPLELSRALRAELPRVTSELPPACAPTSPTIRRSLSTARSRRCSRPTARRSCSCSGSSVSSSATSGQP